MKYAQRNTRKPKHSQNVLICEWKVSSLLCGRDELKDCTNCISTKVYGLHFKIKNVIETNIGRQYHF